MTNPVPKARAMTPAQVVAYLQVSERSVVQWLREGLDTTDEQQSSR